MDDFSKYLINRFSGEQLIGKSIAHQYLRPQESFLSYLHRKENAKFISFGEHLWVERYSNLDEEYNALCNHVGITDVSMVTMIKLTGDNILHDFQDCFSNKIATDKFQTLKYGGLINYDKRLFDDAIIFIESPQEILITLNVNFFSFQRFARNFERLKNWKIKDITQKYGKIQLQGPKASDILHELFTDIPPLGFFHYTHIEDGIISSSGFSRSNGFELFFPQPKTEELWIRLRKMGVKPYGISTMEISRLEAKFICFGHEFAPYQFIPEEIGFSPTTGCPLQKIDSHMIFFYLDRNSIDVSNLPRIGEAIVDAHNKMQGIITSFAYSPFYKSYIGFCHLLTPLSLSPRALFFKDIPIKAEIFHIMPNTKDRKVLTDGTTI